jgi:ribosomal protein L3 glutamine methyltransferase
VLDLCTGNGSLGILVALTYPDCLVHGLDVSQAALDVAAINVARHGLEHRMRLIASDGLQHAEGLYDLIVCNPPYVNSYRMATLPPEFRAEPALALAGGADGMDFIRMLLRDAPRFMSPHAILVLEVGHERAHFESAFPALEAVWLEVSAGTDQVLLLTREALSST